MKIDLEDALASLEDARYEDIDEAVANALFKVGVAYMERKNIPDAAEAFEEAEYLCRKLENREGLAQVSLRAAELDIARGSGGKAVERLESALAFFEEKKDVSTVVLAKERLAYALALENRHRDAAECLEGALELAVGGGDQVAELLMVQQLAPLYRELGDWEKARKAYARMGALADGLGDYQRVALALLGMAACLAQAGERDQALVALEQARDEFVKLGQLERAKMVQNEMDQLSA